MTGYLRQNTCTSYTTVGEHQNQNITHTRMHAHTYALVGMGSTAPVAAVVLYFVGYDNKVTPISCTGLTKGEMKSKL